MSMLELTALNKASSSLHRIQHNGCSTGPHKMIITIGKKRSCLRVPRDSKHSSPAPTTIVAQAKCANGVNCIHKICTTSRSDEPGQESLTTTLMATLFSFFNFFDCLHFQMSCFIFKVTTYSFIIRNVRLPTSLLQHSITSDTFL